MVAEPYLSVVVTTRNDDHGGDPLRRFQAFLTCFSSQCTRFALEAELIVVEWNPPRDRPRLVDAVQWPPSGSCVVRLIEVPSDIHERFRHAESLPLFQMVAKNVGIRRARGQFVLATNMDILCSDELIEFIAAKRLRHDRLYRVDRVDVQAGFPPEGDARELLAYCRQHQIRSHLGHGSFPVKPDGALTLFQDDIVETDEGVQLGDGWHVRERHTTGEPFRWAGPEAELLIDRERAANRTLRLDVQPNPYAPAEGLALLVCDAKGRTLARTDLYSARTIDVEFSNDEVTDRLWLLTPDVTTPRRLDLPVFEQRADLRYRVQNIRWRAGNGHGTHVAHDDAYHAPHQIATRTTGLHIGGWSPTIPWPWGHPFQGLPVAAADGVRVRVRADGLHASTLDRPWAYCLRYPQMTASADGTYEFCLVYQLLEGRITFGALNREHNAWLPHVESRTEVGLASEHLRLSLTLKRGEQFTLVVANGPSGEVTGASRFVVRELRIHTADPHCSILVEPSDGRVRDRVTKTIERIASRLVSSPSMQRLFRPRLRELQAQWDDEVVHRDAAIQAEWVDQLRPRWDSLLEENRFLRQRVASLDQVERVLQESRAPSLHGNGCGNFQLMARDRWHALRAYPEFEMFSMNIDSLFSYIAVQAGVTEVRLNRPLCVYHLEHAQGSGWSPEGEATLRNRIAERGISWLEWPDVAVCAAYMRRLGKPMLFNSAGWGLASANLAERTIGPPEAVVGYRDCNSSTGRLPAREDEPSDTSCKDVEESVAPGRGVHPVFQNFVPYTGDAAPGFERWFYGVNVRDWILTGTSSGHRELRRVQTSRPPVDEEYFDWIALLTAVCEAREKFCIAELGAGWGRWIATAAHLCRQRGIDFQLIGVEAEPTHFDWMQMVLRDNDIDPVHHHLVRAAVWREDGEILLAGRDNPLVYYGCRAIPEGERDNFESVPGIVTCPVSAISLNTLLASHDVVDLMLLDVQGAEYDVLAPAMEVLRRKVKIVHIGTHSYELDQTLKALFRSNSWLKAFAFPCQTTVETTFGEVSFGDGVQTWVNPEWPHLCRVLTDSPS